MRKSGKTISGFRKEHMRNFRPWLKHLKSFRGIGPKTVEGVALTRYLPLYTSIVLKHKKKPKLICETKSRKKNISVFCKKTHTYPQTTSKISVKFQKDWLKVVGGVALTRYLLYLYTFIEFEHRMSKLEMGKMKKKKKHIHILEPWLTFL